MNRSPCMFKDVGPVLKTMHPIREHLLLYDLEFISYQKSVPDILDTIRADRIFSDCRHILLKPNLVNADPFPVTTSCALCEAVIRYIQSCSNADITIAEGCGDACRETAEVFDLLGYTRLALQYGVQLMDLNVAPLVEKREGRNKLYPVMYLPQIMFETFVLSLPVLKAHSLAQMTGTLKNMMGMLPPKYYSGGGIWKKAMFHHRMQDSIIELSRYRTPDLSLMDASIGLSNYHLGGPECNPPVNRLIAGDDPWKMDRYAAQLLGLNPEKIKHLHQHP